MEATRHVLLRARALTKRYGGVPALEGVDLDLRAGEVHAVVGENGAGKSTLLRILGGVHAPDAGMIRIAPPDASVPRPMQLDGVRGAIDAGIALVHQELNLAENLDVAGAIFLGREPARAGVLDRARMRREATHWLRTVGLDVDPSAPCGALPIAHRQLVEIARALACRARVLVLDEPTSSLSAREADRLLGIMRDLCAQGVAVAFVSHHLDEVLRVADRVTVLRDGRMAAHAERGTFDRAALERWMVGRDVPRHEPRALRPDAPVRVRATGVVGMHRTGHAASIEVRAGEIVGLAGLLGAGRTELLEAIAGIAHHGRSAHRAGTVELDGTALSGPTHVRVRRGVCLVPEDRARHGLFLPDTVSTNVSLAWIGRAGARIDRAAERGVVASILARLCVRPADPTRRVQALSGGNQQKTVLGRWTAVAPRVLLLDEPTRGVDVGARAEIHAEIRRLADAGTAVLFASSELEEVLMLADRVVVMHEGRVAGELPAADATEERVMHLATGGTSAGRAA
jgi:ribose transport system ATP-binding protein